MTTTKDSRAMPAPLLGIDTGGTFTDFVLWRDGRLTLHKVLSTPAAPERAILRGIAELGLAPAGLTVIHGSTVATNAALEGKGVRTVYIGNRGLTDLLTIGRQTRADLYDLAPPPPPVPVPAELCLGTGGRLGADGSVVEPLTAADLADLHRQVTALAPRAVAINLLFSWRDDGPERAVATALPVGLFVSRSSEVLALIGEYERGIATWLNASLGPLVADYLERLTAGLPGARLRVMQSSGEAVAAAQTARQAVRLLLSGPAGGLVGARFVGTAAGLPRLLTFDMGGTSTDVALVDGAPRLTIEGQIAGWPVAVPMVDIHTIGAGGGSIARVDAGGLLLVGPESAGADPGPVCYGRGGTRPTVTDANLVLGRLRPDGFLGGRMRLDLPAAHATLATLGRALGLDASAADLAEQAALGVIALANEHMAAALRVMSVQRGLDPRDYTLCSFGGAGGLHVCALAEALGVRRALVPAAAGVLSALGMLVSPPGRLLTRTWPGLLTARNDADVAAALARLATAGVAELAAEGHDPATLTREDSLDLRYQGQSATLNLPWRGVAATGAGFHDRHQARYGHVLDRPVELVNLRVRLSAPAAAVDPVRAPVGGGAVTAAAARRWEPVYGCARPALVLPRAAIAAEETLSGPAVILDPEATLWLAPGWQARRDPAGNVLLVRPD